MPITIRGTRTRGLGIGTETVAAQMPLLVRTFPEITHCFLGTINVELQQPLVVERPDHQTGDITWLFNGSPVTERFGFLRIVFEAPPGGSRVPAWLYIASGSPHRQTRRIHEVLAPRLDIPSQCDCVIAFDRPITTSPDGTITV